MQKEVFVVGMIAVVAMQIFLLFNPQLPQEVRGWLLFLSVGIPLALSVEWVGGKFLGAAFMKKLPTALRILAAVAAFLVLAIILFFVGAVVLRINQF
jgi:hypothetical protein